MAAARQVEENLKRLADARADLLSLELQLEAVNRFRAAEAVVTRLERDLASERENLSTRSVERRALDGELAAAEEVLRRAEESGGLTRMYRRLPKPAEQGEIVAAVRARVHEAERAKNDAHERCESTHGQLRAQRRLVDEARSLLGPADAEEVISRAADARSNVGQLEVEHARLRSAHMDLDGPLRAELQERLSVLADEEMTRAVSAGADLRAQLDALEGCVERVGREIEALDVAVARLEIAELERLIAEGRVRAEELKELIAKAEEQVITDARLVATTLTGAYLRDAIVARTFDVVILDEASMAPIPSLFFAAGLATDSAVVVGDFRQLPPIVISEDEIARRWLGRDIFEVADVTRYEHADDAPPWFVMLREQKRMRPQISRVVNRFIYGGKLRDGSLATP